MPVRRASKPSVRHPSKPPVQPCSRTVQDVSDEILRIFGSDTDLRVVNFELNVVAPSGNTMTLSWSARSYR